MLLSVTPSLVSVVSDSPLSLYLKYQQLPHSQSVRA